MLLARLVVNDGAVYKMMNCTGVRGQSLRDATLLINRCASSPIDSMLC